MNIYLGPKCNFEKRTFFLNSNKTPKNSEIKSYLILLLNPQYFFILGKSFYSLSHIFVIEIIDDKINKIKWSYSQNLRKLKYENNEIPNSLRGSLSCVEFLGSSQQCNKNMICNDDLCITFQIENLGCCKPTPLKINLALEIRVV